VNDISVTDLQKIFELRIVLEGFCARLAAQRVTEDQLEKMENVLQDLEQVKDGGPCALMRIDKRFHRLLYQAADNEFMTDILNRQYDLSLRLWYLVLSRLTEVRHSIEQHFEVLSALREGNSSRAEAVIQKHIVEFQQSIKSAL
jgi:DNA-binding GntR family transcriptional regulator